MNKVASTTVAGLALALAAAIPSHGLVVLLRGPEHEAGAGLLAGIAAFRVCLMLLGGYVVFLGRFAAAYPAPRAAEPAQTQASRPEALLFAAILAVAALSNRDFLERAAAVPEPYALMGAGALITNTEIVHASFKKPFDTDVGPVFW